MMTEKKNTPPKLLKAYQALLHYSETGEIGYETCAEDANGCYVGLGKPAQFPLSPKDLILRVLDPLTDHSDVTLKQMWRIPLPRGVVGGESVESNLQERWPGPYIGRSPAEILRDAEAKAADDQPEYKMFDSQPAYTKYMRAQSLINPDHELGRQSKARQKKLQSAAGSVRTNIAKDDHVLLQCNLDLEDETSPLQPHLAKVRSIGSYAKDARLLLKYVIDQEIRAKKLVGLQDSKTGKFTPTSGHLVRMLEEVEAIISEK